MKRSLWTMKTSRFCLTGASALLAAALLLAGGCEHSGDDSIDLTIHASSEELRAGESCSLHADLLDPYIDDRAHDDDFTWSLSDPSIGYLSSTRGRRVVYHPTRMPVAPEKELVQTVFCKFDGSVFLNGSMFNHHTRQKIHHLPERNR